MSALLYHVSFNCSSRVGEIYQHTNAGIRRLQIIQQLGFMNCGKFLLNLKFEDHATFYNNICKILSNNIILVMHLDGYLGDCIQTLQTQLFNQGILVNLFKKTVADMMVHHDKGVEIDVVAIGRKGIDYFKRQNANMVAQTSHLGDTPHINELIGTVKVMLDAYTEGTIDALYLVSNEFVNTMTQQADVQQILPIAGAADEALKHHWDYIYEPDSKDILDALLMRFVESQVYQGVVENIACEMSARMIAMKSATDNAGDIIKGLETAYNKARQAAITQEISEIVGGAAAV